MFRNLLLENFFGKSISGGEVLRAAGVEYFVRAMRIGADSLPDSPAALPLAANPDFGLWLRQHGVGSRQFLEMAVRPDDW